jgi:ATP-dependent DNA helicase RecG
MGLLQNDIKYLPGVGPKRAELLNNDIGVHTLEDLLYYFPYKHVDRTRYYKIEELTPDLPYVQVTGKIIRYTEVGKAHKKRLTAQFADETGVIELVWFKGIKWIQDFYKPGVEYLIYGKPSLFGSRINIPHPEIEEAEKQEQSLKAALQPFYNTSEKMKNFFLTSRTLHRLVGLTLNKCFNEIRESLPDYLLKRCSLIGLQQAILNIHYPQSVELLRQAEYRLKFEELFSIQLSLLKQKINRESMNKGLVFEKVGDYLNSFYNKNLKFELTNAQKRVIKEIRKDLGSGKQMNRLLQGDVGSGKTLVALMLMLIALDNRYQTCLMAPTEILATQHFFNLSQLISGLGIHIKLLTGSTKKSERSEINEGLTNGEIQILIGTHALIEDVVQFKNLGLVVIDEQHRFGVAQRAKLWHKNSNPPHVLVMTATPIPRTLAMTVYGDLDVSIIDELPPGRKPIQTKHVAGAHRSKIIELLKTEIGKGRQIYIVYPLIKESEKLDYKALEQGYESTAKVFPSPDYSVSMVHGQMKAKDKESSMKQFVEGKIDIMVATTVIEVGVDVPNASVMVIESAERFGLSQLHQLRGRVGRGAEQSFCILSTSHKLSEDARKRLAIMEATTDGFEIAEADLKLRGPGDIEGTQQSGIPFDLRIAHLGKDQQILQYARDKATEILESDPSLEKPENARLKALLAKARKDAIEWRAIS